MHIFIFFLMLKIAFAVFVAMLGLMFAIEFFPQWANEVMLATKGTLFYFAGELLAQGLNFMAVLSAKILQALYNILAKFGIDVTMLREAAEQGKNITKEAVKEAK